MTNTTDWPTSKFRGPNDEPLVEVPIDLIRPQEGVHWACERCVFSPNCTAPTHTEDHCYDPPIIYLTRIDAVTLKLTGKLP